MYWTAWGVENCKELIKWGAGMSIPLLISVIIYCVSTFLAAGDGIKAELLRTNQVILSKQRPVSSLPLVEKWIEIEDGLDVHYWEVSPCK